MKIKDMFLKYFTKEEREDMCKRRNNAFIEAQRKENTKPDPDSVRHAEEINKLFRRRKKNEQTADEVTREFCDFVNNNKDYRMNGSKEELYKRFYEVNKKNEEVLVRHVVAASLRLKCILNTEDNDSSEVVKKIRAGLKQQLDKIEKIREMVLHED